MFCFQCQETAKGTGCTIRGVCGKTDDLAVMQDLLIYVLKGISHFALIAREKGLELEEANTFITGSLFATITNANFDKQDFIGRVKKGLELRNKLRMQLSRLGVEFENLPESATWQANTDDAFESKAVQVGVLRTSDEDIRSLREMITYGIKGMAAYTEHANNLGFYDDSVCAFMQKGLLATVDDSLTAEDLVKLVMETGEYGLKAMALLDKANTSTYGNPEISQVNIGVGKKPGILISGHDLHDMEELLKQTEGSGVDVYTHSEMLPANYYPAFKKYKHLIGNYGSSWWKQKEEFESFNGPVLFTSNCLVPPLSTAKYADKVFTTGVTGYPGFKHISDRLPGGEKDFSEIITLAKKCQPPVEIENGAITGGFAHNQVHNLAGKVVEAIKAGKIKKFVVMAGCDGRMNSRQYYTDFASKLPGDTVILTAGCAKYRYNKLHLGAIDGIPRVLDAGQCNDSYSLALIAMELRDAFGLKDINDLPVVYNIAWYEQKAVIVLLALLYLGVKNIHLGPTLPGFLSPNIAKILVDNFGIARITNPDDDINLFFN